MAIRRAGSRPATPPPEQGQDRERPGTRAGGPAAATRGRRVRAGRVVRAPARIEHRDRLVVSGRGLLVDTSRLFGRDGLAEARRDGRPVGLAFRDVRDEDRGDCMRCWRRIAGTRRASGRVLPVPREEQAAAVSRGPSRRSAAGYRRGPESPPAVKHTLRPRDAQGIRDDVDPALAAARRWWLEQHPLASCDPNATTRR